MTKTQTALVFALLLISSLRPCLAEDSPIAISRKTERVVVLSIDGIRNLEGFLHRVPAGQDHPYIPRIWEEIKPSATVFTNMLLLEKASTTTGIATLYSGYWNNGPNRLSVICACNGGYRDNRSHAPLIGEHVIKDLGMPAGAVAFYNNKRNLLICDYSFHPNYGAGFAPGVNVFVDSKAKEFAFRQDIDEDGIFEFVDDTNADDVLMRQMMEDLEFRPEKTLYPTLISAHFGVVDLAGHVNQFGLYADAIRNADALVADFWAFLQDHPVYAGKTTMIVTTDHGRHDDEHGGFADHNGSCPGCRNLFFLAIGPDTLPGQTVTRVAYMVDVAPTVANLLGTSMPHAHGRVLPELVRSPSSIVERISDHRAVADGSGIVIAATRDTPGLGSHVVVWRGVQDGGDLSLTSPLVASTGSAILAHRPSLLFGNNGSLIVAFRELFRARGYWKIRTARSIDGGLSFSSPATILQGRREVESRLGFHMVVHPVLQGTPLGDHLFVPMKAGQVPDHLVRVTSHDDFLSASGVDVVIRTDAAIPLTSEFDMVDSVGFGDGSFGVSWVQLDYPFNDDPNEILSYEVFYRPGFDTGFGDVFRLTNDPDPSLHPSLAFDFAADRLFVTYAVRGSGGWQVFLRESGDRGDTWSVPLAVTASSVGAWKPSSAFDPATGLLHIVYEDYGTGEADVFSTTYDPIGGQLSASINVSNSIGVSRGPRVIVLGDGAVYATWEELEINPGRYQLNGKRIN